MNGIRYYGVSFEGDDEDGVEDGVAVGVALDSLVLLVEG